MIFEDVHLAGPRQLATEKETIPKGLQGKEGLQEQRDPTREENSARRDGFGMLPPWEASCF